MAVFDGAVKVPRAVADPKTDKNLPLPGSLSWGGIKSATGLAGTTGIDCKLVHGDRWQQIEGKLTENIVGDSDTTVMQNQTLNVLANRNITASGNHTETVVGTRNDTVIGPHNHVNVAVRNNTYVSPKSEIHAGEKGSEESGSWFKSVAMEGRVCGYSVDLIAIKNEAVNLAICATIQAVELGVIKGEAWVMKKETQMCKDEEEALEAKFSALDSKIEALDAKVGALEPHAVPAKINAGVRVGIDTPWGG